MENEYFVKNFQYIFKYFKGTSKHPNTKDASLIVIKYANIKIKRILDKAVLIVFADEKLTVFIT